MKKWLLGAVAALALLPGRGGQARADLISPADDGNVRRTVFGQSSVDTSSFLLFANLNPVNDDRAVLEFPLASVPGGSTVTSATLRLNVIQGGGTVGQTGAFQ